MYSDGEEVESEKRGSSVAPVSTKYRPGNYLPLLTIGIGVSQQRDQNIRLSVFQNLREGVATFNHESRACPFVSFASRQVAYHVM